MDDAVLRSMAKWPNVPDVYGWLSLDRRGNFLIRNEKIGNRALREFIARNYQPDARGCWYFQNGPQRVFVTLAYTPLVVHSEGEALVDQCGRPFRPAQAFLDEEGSVLFSGSPGAALLDDRDLGQFSERALDLARIAKTEAPGRFGYVAAPHA
jgi:hypothetical protein